MKTIELFCGMKSFTKVALSLGHDTWTTDINHKFDPDYCNDALDIIAQAIIWLQVKESDIVWMSPPCTTFSLASGGKHWNIDRQPLTDDAIKGKAMLDFCWQIAKYCIDNDKIFFIENPNGRAVWFSDNRYLHKVWYCQYGDTRAKPTNIWTNLKDWAPKTCKNNNPTCNHIRAKRGSRTGTQGLKNAVERSIIPEALFYEIFSKVKT